MQIIVSKPWCSAGTSGLTSIWGKDANINLQMNYWFAEMTAMDVVNPVFNYIEVLIRLR